MVKINIKSEKNISIKIFMGIFILTLSFFLVYWFCSRDTILYKKLYERSVSSNIFGLKGENFNIVSYVVKRAITLMVTGLLSVIFGILTYGLLNSNIVVTEEGIRGKSFWGTTFNLKTSYLKKVDISPFHGINIYLEDDRLSLCGLANNKEICEAINSLMHGENPQVENTIRPQVVSESIQNTESVPKEEVTNASQKLFCTQCGVEILSAGKFCAKCGNPINGR